jgi:hypothetical protein
MQRTTGYRWIVAAACIAAAGLFAAPVKAEGLEAKGDYIPMAVWLQNPDNAEKYKAIGINVYIGLHKGPTETQLEKLRKAGVVVACDQNKVALDDKWKDTIVGWLQDDEPDNAQLKPEGKGYGPPVLPEKIVERYKEMKAADKLNRPVMLNLNMAVAYDKWVGRGTRRNKPEDYPEYVKGGDIVSFDIYPVCSDIKEVSGKISYVGTGVKRLVNWVDNKKPVWTCIETTHISHPTNRVTPKQVRSEVWMAIINGARGIIYFAHEFKPKFIEAGLLHYPEIAEAVKNVNAEVQSFAKLINDGKAIEGAKVDKKEVALLTRESDGIFAFFASGMEEGPITATFELPGLKGKTTLKVSGENRTVEAVDGKWTDTFTGYEAHVYTVKAGG